MDPELLLARCVDAMSVIRTRLVPFTTFIIMNTGGKDQIRDFGGLRFGAFLKRLGLEEYSLQW